MTKSARSIFVFSLYLFGMGIVLVLTPNTLLSLVSVPETTEVWIRVVGMLAFILGYYYWVAARGELVDFFKATVVGRGVVLIFFTVFVLTELAPPVLLLFGAIDVSGAIWTALSLKADARQQQA